MSAPGTRLLALSAKELRLLLRDRHGLLVLFAMPAAFILVMSLALQNVFDARRSGGVAVLLQDHDGAPLARQFASQLGRVPQFRLLAPQARAGEHPPLTVTLLPGFSELLATRYDFASDYIAGAREPQLLRLEYAQTLPAPMRAALEMVIRQTVIAVESDYLLSTVLERPQSELTTLRYLLDPAHLPLDAGGASVPGPSAVQQSVPAWLIFAMFFTVVPLSTSFVIERGQGTLQRMRVLGISPGLLFAAKAVAYYLVNMVQIVLMLVIGVWIVPLLGGEQLELGGSAAGLFLIGSATSLASIGLALLVAVNSRSILQATATGGALCLLMAAIGGIMVPSAVMPVVMQRLAQYSPMSWSLEGFLGVLLHHGSPGGVLQESAYLTAFALASFAGAVLSIHRQLQFDSNHA